MKLHAYWSRRAVVVAGLSAALFAMGCATSKETDPGKVSFADTMWGNDRLEEHLESRRRVLAGLRQRTIELQSQLTLRLSDLQRAEGEVLASSRTEVETRRRLADINSRRIQIERAKDELSLTKQRLEQSQQADAAYVERLRREVSQLGVEVDTLDQAVDRTLRNKEAQALRASEY
jgi:hypothetical protein